MLISNDLIAQLNIHAGNNANAFPGQGRPDYAARFQMLADHLNEHVHPQVERAALQQSASEIKQIIERVFTDDKASSAMLKKWSEEGIPPFVYLNDHGPKHIEMVIRRASRLVSVMGCKLTPYEIYILLAAIHFHDVGNLYGRDKHEQRIANVMNRPDIKPLVGGDTERRFIKLIAAAHGGKVLKDKNTIGYLPEYDANLSYRVRLQYLAAILRFADELADDRSRAATHLLTEDKILQGSEIYHRYSNCLASVSIEEKRIELKFELSVADVLQTFSKGNEQVFLIDEIFERTLKMHSEAVYCMRFMRSVPSAMYENIVESDWVQHISPIESIKVSVEIYESSDEGTPIDTLEYTLREDGYPTFTSANIYDICREIDQHFRGRLGTFPHLTGQALKQIIEQQIGTTNNE